MSATVLLAPMAGVSDLAFRDICIAHGADLTYSEMVSAKGLSYGSEKTKDLIKLSPSEKVIGVQLFGHESDVMASQAAWVEDVLQDRLACIDINMGCPARKIVAKGDGAALMKSPDLAKEIVRAVKRSVRCPVSVKFRRGWAQGDDTSVSFAKIVEDAGADAITLHGRYAMQYYKGSSDRACIAAVKNALSIPVIGNGDIRCGQDALSMLDQTGCDHVMVARSAVGNPWIFEEIHAAFDGRAFKPPTLEERINAMREHARKLHDMHPRLLLRMRKHAAAYIKGIPGASAARASLNECTTLDDFYRLFDAFAQRASIGASSVDDMTVDPFDDLAEQEQEDAS